MAPIQSVSWVPQGNLPKWLLVVSFLATFNCVQNYIDHSFARKVYTHGLAQVTPLSSRTFGIWNLTSAIIRAYCAYNMNNKPLYEICMLTYVIALTHFISEVVVYKTARLTPGIISPLIVASISLGSMLYQYSYYIR